MWMFWFKNSGKISGLNHNRHIVHIGFHIDLSIGEACKKVFWSTFNENGFGVVVVF